MRRARILASVIVLFPIVAAACGSSDQGASSETPGGGETTGGSGKGGGASGAGGKAGASGTGASGGTSAGGSGAKAGAPGGGAGGASGGSGGTTSGGNGGKSGAGAKGGSAGSSGGGAGAKGGSATAGSGGSGASAGASGASGQGGAAGGPGCQSSSECNGGVCYMGQCCASQSAICGTGCCDAGQACLFGACVTPGQNCQTSADCGAGSYCEIALGSGNGSGGSGGSGGSASGGSSGTGGMVCTQPVPQNGKCLALPPVCDPNGNPPGCVPQCEYKPPVGPLQAVQKWTWDPTDIKQYPNFVDVWATPTVGRIVDANCDGKVDELDPPDIVFVSGKSVDATTGVGTCCQCTGTTPTACHTGVLRMLDGRTGEEIWSLRKESSASSGWAGLSVAIGDVTNDGRMDVLAVSGEGYVVAVDASGKVIGKSDKAIAGAAAGSFGWGGGLALGDMDNDGSPEVAYGATVFTTKGMTTSGTITELWAGAKGRGGTANDTALSFFADVDGAADGHLELVAGNTVYKADGTVLWNRADLPDGFPAVADFDKDGLPEIVHVAKGVVTIVKGIDGTTVVSATLPGNGDGGPPTVADFDGDGFPEVGVAQANFYSMLKPDLAAGTFAVVWKTPNHDLSSSVTGSSVFDFEGDGRAEVVYNDECFLWVYDGPTGHVRFAVPTDSFTATESSLVADADGDGHAELIRIANGADPSSGGWGCDVAPWNQVSTSPDYPHPAWKKPAYGPGFRGVTLYGDVASSWVGTRTIWNQHAYSVTNICDDHDDACDLPNYYGAIPAHQKKNWTVPWLDDFRQNVQDKGIFDAPDAIVDLAATCTKPVGLTVSVKNNGLATLPANVQVDVYQENPETLLGTVQTTQPLAPGQTQQIAFPTTVTDTTASFQAKIYVDPSMPNFHECNTMNDDSKIVQPACIKP